MDEKDFNIGDILEEKNSEALSAQDISKLDDIAFLPSTFSAALKNAPSEPDSEHLTDNGTDEASENDEAENMQSETENAPSEEESTEQIAETDPDEDSVPSEQTEEAVEEPDADDQGEDEADVQDQDDNVEDDTDSEDYDDEYYDDDDYDDDYRPRRIAPSKNKKVNNSIFGGLILVTVILTLSLVFAITGIKLGMEYLGVGKNDEEITFNIPENASNDQIVDLLIDYNLINNKRLFKIALKFRHSPKLYAGDVTLKPSMGYAKIIDTLSSSRDLRETVRITFPEGMTLIEVARKLEEKKVCSASDFIFQFNKNQDFSYEKMIEPKADAYYKMEGFCFPDTYEFYVDDTGSNAARTIKANFAEKFTDEMTKTMQQKNMTLGQVVTLASIVQWEANSVKDMPKVASVFINRLNDPRTFPKLESDATKKYISKGLENDVDGTTKEFYTNLYDTYKCEGLPAGPVCNPGIDAIKAVLYPEQSNYLFFCNDLKTGESFFAETYEEHKQNLIKAGLM